MQSKLISAKHDIEHELRIASHGRIDPKRKRYLVNKLLQIERDIQTMGYNPDEVKTNEVNYGGNANTISGKQHLVSTWMDRDGKKENK